jgi:protein ImuA
LWATDLALRSRAAALVIADGSGFDLAATRRLQLAAEAGDGLCLLARPPWEQRELSAAATRWLVSCAPPQSTNQRWTVQLLRCKGQQPASNLQRVWILEQDHATGALRVAADVLDRSGEAEAGEARVRRIG